MLLRPCAKKLLVWAPSAEVSWWCYGAAHLAASLVQLADRASWSKNCLGLAQTVGLLHGSPMQFPGSVYAARGCLTHVLQPTELLQVLV